MLLIAGATEMASTIALLPVQSSWIHASACALAEEDHQLFTYTLLKYAAMPSAGLVTVL